jgi:hypothetical protein
MNLFYSMAMAATGEVMVDMDTAATDEVMADMVDTDTIKFDCGLELSRVVQDTAETRDRT